MNQEDYVYLHALKKRGWSHKEVAAKLGYHPDTISRRLREGPPTRVEVPDLDRPCSGTKRFPQQRRCPLLRDQHADIVACGA
jgi:IS30 family transposase